jgi:hypothetical protein
VVMSSSETTKKVIAASYLIAYVSAVLWALGASGGASGGMAFVFPVILGFPWSLLLGLLLLVAPFPKIVILVLLLVVPPAINVYLILRTRGTFWFKQDLNRSVAAKDSDPHNEEVP